jgi:hypothetical protein
MDAWGSRSDFVGLLRPKDLPRDPAPAGGVPRDRISFYHPPDVGSDRADPRRRIQVLAVVVWGKSAWGKRSTDTNERADRISSPIKSEPPTDGSQSSAGSLISWGSRLQPAQDKRSLERSPSPINPQKNPTPHPIRRLSLEVNDSHDNLNQRRQFVGRDSPLRCEVLQRPR